MEGAFYRSHDVEDELHHSLIAYCSLIKNTRSRVHIIRSYQKIDLSCKIVQERERNARNSALAAMGTVQQSSLLRYVYVARRLPSARSTS